VFIIWSGLSKLALMKWFCQMLRLLGDLPSASREKAKFSLPSPTIACAHLASLNTLPTSFTSVSKSMAWDSRQAQTSSATVLADVGPGAENAGGPPPAYSLESALPSNESDRKPSPTHERHVRICPHQTLSFERCHEIVNLPNIKSAKSLDAFIKLPTAQHEVIVDRFRKCTTVKSSDGLLHLSSYVSFCYEHISAIPSGLA